MWWNHPCRRTPSGAMTENQKKETHRMRTGRENQVKSPAICQRGSARDNTTITCVFITNKVTSEAATQLVMTEKRRRLCNAFYVRLHADGWTDPAPDSETNCCEILNPSDYNELLFLSYYYYYYFEWLISVVCEAKHYIYIRGTQTRRRLEYHRGEDTLFP